MAGTSPAMTAQLVTRTIARFDDLPHRYLDRTDRDPDVVAAGGADGGDGENPRLSTGGDNLCDRRAGGGADLDRTARGRQGLAATACRVGRRRRRTVRISRAVFPGLALRAAGRSRV